MILVSMRATDIENAELSSYHSRILHRLGARCGKIAEFRAEFRSLGSCLRNPFWRDSFLEI